MFFSFFIFTYSCCCFFCILIICCSLSRSGIISILLWFITIITFFCWWCWVSPLPVGGVVGFSPPPVGGVVGFPSPVSLSSFFFVISIAYFANSFSDGPTYEIFPSFFIYFCAFGEESNVVFNLSATIGLNVQF